MGNPVVGWGLPRALGWQAQYWIQMASFGRDQFTVATGRIIQCLPMSCLARTHWMIIRLVASPVMRLDKSLPWEHLMYHLGSFCSEHTFGIVAALCSVSVCLQCVCDCAFGLPACYDPVPPLLLYMFVRKPTDCVQTPKR